MYILTFSNQVEKLNNYEIIASLSRPETILRKDAGFFRICDDEKGTQIQN